MALKKKTAILAAVIAAGLLLVLDVGQYLEYLSLENLKEQQQEFVSFYLSNPFLTLGAFFGIYVLSTAFSVPGATVLTLAGGALFGFWAGLLVVSFASTLGATLAFLMARYFLRDYVQVNFGERLKMINRGIEREGSFYLFSMRLVPFIPFFVINLVMGLTPMKAWRFFVVSQVGMLLGTAVYVNAGTQLAQIESMSGIMSLRLALSFALLGLFPLIAKKMVDFLKSRKALKNYTRPKQYEYNMVVIGAGAGGLVSSYIAAAVKAKVALIEKHKMGGDCLNTGCVPSKALIRTAKVVAEQHKAQNYGLESIQVKFNFQEIMDRVHRVIQTIEPHDSRERYEGLGVECIEGEARIKTPWEVEVNGRTLTTKNIVIATGAAPLVPPIPGLENVPYKTSDTLWDITEQPRQLLVLGGGPIGSELSQAFHRLGTKVTLMEMAPRILNREDEEVSAFVDQKFRKEGIEVLVGHKATQFFQKDGKHYVHCELADGSTTEIEFDLLLIAMGRKPNTKGFGLEELGVQLTPGGQIATDPLLRTNFPNIYAVGDVTGELQFTHVAAHEAWYAAVNALFGPFKTYAADYRVIPMVTYTDPEVARVGINESEAQARGISFEVSCYGIDDLDRAIADEAAEGIVKVLTVPGKDKILGVTIVGQNAGEILAEFVLAMKYNLGLNKILGTVHAYPTTAEANKYAAGVWKKAHAPQSVLAWVEKFHAWRRGGS